MKFLLSLLIIINFVQATVICSNKSYLPLTIETQIKGATAQVTITYLQALTNVNIEFKGIDGLSSITADKDHLDLTVVAQQKDVYNLNFEAPQGKSYLTVKISALLNGKKVGMVKGFGVGELSLSQKASKNVSLPTDASGKKIIIMPATIK